MPVKKTNSRSRRSAPRRTRKVARTAKGRTTRTVVRGRRTVAKKQSRTRKAKSRVVVVRGSQRKVRNPFNVLQAGPDGFVVRVAGVRGVIKSAWVFGN
jgi:hypothetical protein